MSNPTRVNHFSVDLRRLTILIGAAIAFFGVSLLAIIAYAGWSANQAAAEIERTLVENALNQSIVRVLSEEKSVAWWDDAVTKITDEAIDLDFVDLEFGIFLSETYGHDEIYIVNKDNNPIYAYLDKNRAAPSVFERRRALVAPLIAEVRGQASTLRRRDRNPSCRPRRAARAPR